MANFPLQSWAFFHNSKNQEYQLMKRSISSVSETRDLTLHSSVRDVSLSVRTVDQYMETKG